MSTLTILNKSNKRNALLVYGYVKESQQLFNGRNTAYDNIPALVSQIILAYHYMHAVSDRSRESDKYLPWWHYGYVTLDGKYKITVEWQQRGHGNWHKVAARNCTLNGKAMKLISFSFGKNHGYSQNEILRFCIPENGTICRLYWIKTNKWCFDDGIGIYSNLKPASMNEMGTEPFI